MYTFINKILNLFKKNKVVQKQEEDLLEIILRLDTEEMICLKTTRGYKNIKSSLEKVLAVLALQNKHVHTAGVNIVTINSMQDMNDFDDICKELKIR
jgi:hypothetical protein